MLLKIDSVTKEPRTSADGTVHWGIKSGEQWYNLCQEEKPVWRSTIDVEVKSETFKGRTTRWARVIQLGQTTTPKQSALSPEEKTALAPAKTNGNGAGSGKIPWLEYERVVKKASEIASMLEPGETDASARAAIINTIVIAFTRGDVMAPEHVEGEDAPF